MLLYIFQFKFSKNLFTADTGQVIVLDPPAQVAVKDDVVKNIGQTDVIPALRSGGEADTPFCPGKVIQNRPVAFGCTVVRFINDDGIKSIRGKAFHPARTGKALHTGGNHLFIPRMLLCLFYAKRAVKILFRLPYQLIPVRQQQHSSISFKMCHYDCFSQSCCHDHQVVPGGCFI